MSTALGVHKRGLVVLDVDGVIFPRQFIAALAWRRGAPAFLGTLCDCVLFNVGRMQLETLLSRAFGRLRGTPWEEVCHAYREMPITPHSKEAIASLKAAGMRVMLLTAGVPDPLVKDLAGRLGADDGAGTEVRVSGGLLTGDVSGELAHSAGKLCSVARLVEREGIPWSDVVVVGDDRNNLPLMRRSGVSIGFHATYGVRREARYLVEDDDLSAILPYALGPSPTAFALQSYTGRRVWHREIVRKALHMTATAVPFLVPRFPITVNLLLLCSIALYLVSELWRLNGAYVPVAHQVNRWAMRRRESREPALGPVTLALGVLVSLWCLPLSLALACILVTAVADSAASVIGERWGRVPWPHNPLKSLEGTAAFLVSAVVCASVYLPLQNALLLAVIAAAMESLPLEDWDNFVTPVGTGMIAAVVLGM